MPETPGESAVRLSLVIPLYRDEAGLEPIFERCGALLDERGPGELVLVDDGGLDRTTPRAVALAEGYRHPVCIVRLARNFGQHPAVFAGLAHARGDVVVTLDSDLQYPPEEVPRLLEALDDDHPVASGARSARSDPWPRSLITRLLTRYLNRRTGAQLSDFGSMFRAYRREVVEQMLQFTERHRFVPAVVAWLGVRIREVPVRHEPRGERGSRYRLSSLLDLLLDLVTGYSIFPLRILSAIGLTGAAVGFLVAAAFAVYRLVEGSGVSGTVSAFALLFALAAVQLMLLATLGEYVGRVYSEAKARPYYLVAEVRRGGGDGGAGGGA
jgi:undecaprenyl-phosphate 4-deoxy-4-formamido-L-arabinose transferase